MHAYLHEERAHRESWKGGERNQLAAAAMCLVWKPYCMVVLWFAKYISLSLCFYFQTLHANVWWCLVHTVRTCLDMQWPLVLYSTHTAALICWSVQSPRLPFHRCSLHACTVSSFGLIQAGRRCRPQANQPKKEPS